MRPRKLGIASLSRDARRRSQQSVEGRLLIRLQIDEEEARRAIGQFGFEQARKIGLDQRDRDQHREAKSERRDDRGGRRAAAMEIAEAQPRRGAARMNPPRHHHQPDREHAEQDAATRPRRR